MAATGGARRAWMIEDDEMIARLVRIKLEKAGWILDSFRTIGEFRRSWTEGAVLPPDVLVLDRNLPDGSGLELARELVSRAGGGKVHCLLVSASPRDAETPAGVRWIRKPFLPTELLEAMEALLRESGPGDRVEEMSGEGDAELDALRAEYRSSFPEKRRALEEAFREGRSDTILVMAHQLAGSAGLYGFPGVQAAAAALEDVLRAGPGAAAAHAGLLRRLSEELS